MWSEELGYIILFLSLFLVPLFLFGISKLLDYLVDRSLNKYGAELEEDRKMRESLGIPDGKMLRREYIRPDKEEGKEWDGVTYIYIVDGKKVEFSRFKISHKWLPYDYNMSPFDRYANEEIRKECASHHASMIRQYPKIYDLVYHVVY